MRIDFEIALPRKPRIMETLVLSWELSHHMFLWWGSPAWAATRYLICSHVAQAEACSLAFKWFLMNETAQSWAWLARFAAKWGSPREKVIRGLTVVCKLASSGWGYGQTCWAGGRSICLSSAHLWLTFHCPLTLSEIVKQDLERAGVDVQKGSKRKEKIYGYSSVSQT